MNSGISKAYTVDQKLIRNWTAKLISIIGLLSSMWLLIQCYYLFLEPAWPAPVAFLIGIAGNVPDVPTLDNTWKAGIFGPFAILVFYLIGLLYWVGLAALCAAATTTATAIIKHGYSGYQDLRNSQVIRDASFGVIDPHEPAGNEKGTSNNSSLIPLHWWVLPLMVGFIFGKIF